MKKSQLLLVRDNRTLNSAKIHGLNAEILPCPALLAAQKSSEKNINSVAVIGFIYQTTVEKSVVWNGCNEKTHNYQISLINAIKENLNEKLILICHYNDDFEAAKSYFPDSEILYSYASSDYEDIYKNCDIVIGTRVHGIGIAASLGIPGIAISHDSRGDTCRGFLATIINTGDDIKSVIEIVKYKIKNIELLSDALKKYKTKILSFYQDALRLTVYSEKYDYKIDMYKKRDHKYAYNEKNIVNSLQLIIKNVKN